MLHLNDYSIRTRLFVLAAVSVLSMLIVGGDGVWSLARSNTNFERFVAEDVQSLQLIAQLHAGVGNLRRYEKDVLINIGDDAALKKYRESWQATADGVVKRLDELDKLEVSTEVRALVPKLRTSLASYRKGFEEVSGRVINHDITDTVSGNKAMGPFKDAIRSMEGQLDELIDLVNKDSVTEVQHVKDDAASGRNALIVIVLAGFAVVVFFTIFNVRSILTPLGAAVSSAQRIADHDLSGTVRVVGKDETAVMMASIRAMQDALAGVVRGVRGSTDSIATASRQVAIGSQDLSDRTEQTAANLEKTASAMEELTASVAHNAQSSRQATELARDAAQVAERGGAVVGEVVSTMDRISQSSRRISDIIGVIDGIAFQTNILALNAAVEAARAGEQGRGFAVVAGEVRTLAQRSAEAAKEIKQLIGASTESVETGAQLVSKAGATMNDIVSSVQRVSSIVSEISNATAEQSEGIGQIGQAIAMLDQMTQQNAALVEESAAAAKSLQEQAVELAKTVLVFKL